ncbi:MAG: hypothetical protein L0H79_21920 [Intrasporangium sp.]|uniref:hypothetical protein n=1 Tax=Intrasporangium sp. TaxID=1925024 RepID=UPI002649C1EA|nr:hypothetical protein [Intrasporangium sp.]MDN5798385.1 hypothetical protein [Intrasporangium sp.]
MSELKPRRARANAFDLARTDRDDVEVTLPVAPLSDLLPRIADRTPAKAASLHRSPRTQSPWCSRRGAAGRRDVVFAAANGSGPARAG